jgi:hypothetical protein
MLAAVELSFDHPRTEKRIVFSIPENTDSIVAAFTALGAAIE